MLDRRIANNVELARANLKAAQAVLDNALAMQALTAKATEETGPYDLEELRKPLNRGAIKLGKIVPSTTLRAFNREWRRLLNDLRTPNDSPRFKAAEAALAELHVTWQDRPRNNRRDFCWLY